MNWLPLLVVFGWPLIAGFGMAFLSSRRGWKIVLGAAGLMPVIIVGGIFAIGSIGRDPNLTALNILIIIGFFLLPLTMMYVGTRLGRPFAEIWNERPDKTIEETFR